MPLPSFPTLCLTYTEVSKDLPRDLSILYRREVIARLAWGAVRARQAIPQPVLEGLVGVWSDHRLRELHPHQKLILQWFGALTAGAWSTDETWARGVVGHTLEAALSVWTPGISSSTLQKPRRAVWELDDSLEELDPSGDPEEPYQAVTLEPVRRGALEWSWSTVGEVLEGVDAWGAALQQHLHLPVGDVARAGQPDWTRFRDQWRGIQWREIEEAFREAA